jgi:tRNA A-37 threonylcarbamoyl transferase component Bud32
MGGVNSQRPRLVEVTTGDVRWQVRPECREQLLSPDGLRLDEWLRTGQARVVKHGPHRSVYAVALSNFRFYVKHNRLANARVWLRDLVRPSKARMECERAVGVAARRVSTIAPLAVGERPLGLGRWESFLITAALDGAAPLDAFLENQLLALDSARQTRLRQRLAVVLGQFLARMHDTGIFHHDLHAGNLMIHLDEHDRPTLHLIDLHGVQLGQGLSWTRSRANLVVFNRYFMLHANRSDRLRFFTAYHQARSRSCRWPDMNGIAPDRRVAELARDLEKRTLRSNERFWRQRDRRCLVTNRYYRRVRSAGLVGHVVADLDASALAPMLADPDEPFRRAGIKILKDSPTSKVVEFDMNLQGATCRVIYKRFSIKTRLCPLLSLFRPPPALRSWVYGQSLRERCLSTARPLAVFHRRRAGLLREGYLLTVKLPSTAELPRFLDQLLHLPGPERLMVLRDRIDQVARLIRELHRRRISHRDLKGSNILTTAVEHRRDAVGASLIPVGCRPYPDIWVIDLAGVRSPRRLRRARRIQNLARLNASVGRHPMLTRTDALRFLRVYLQWGVFGVSGWKVWWRAIDRTTQAKVQRNARNGRPLT